VVRRWATYSVRQGSYAKGKWLAYGCGGIRDRSLQTVWDPRRYICSDQSWIRPPLALARAQNISMTSVLPT
jgi:hypothetical protein